MADKARGRRRLSDADSLMWRIESDPVLRSPVLVVGLLDRAPKRPRLRRRLELVTGEIHGLRQRIVPPRLGVGRAEWHDDPRFSVEHHLRWIRAPEGGIRGVLDFAEPDAMAAFDPERPPWSLTIVEGLGGGASAFVLRFHHSITDGVGGLLLADQLFDRTRRATAKRARSADPVAVSTPRGSSRLLRSAGDAARAAADFARQPIAAAGASMSLGRSVVRLVAPAPPSESTLLAGRGLDRRLHVFELPVASLREAATAVGATVNDLLLAAVGGAFETYHRKLGAPVAAMTVTVPVDRRADADPAGGNRFTPTRFVLPVDDPDVVTRAKIAGSFVRSWREEPALGLTDLLAGGLNLLPAPIVTRFFGRLLRTIDADVTDLRGLDRPVFLAGARIDRMWAFAPPTGAAFSVTLLSHGDTACVAVACDRAAVTDTNLLIDCLEAGFDEVVAVAHRGPTTEVES